MYLDLYADYRNKGNGDKETINDDVVFEIELVKQVEINVDYILMLVEKYRQEHGNGQDKEIRAEISRAVDASPTLRDKKDLIETFVDTISLTNPVDQEWQQFIAAKREQELHAIIDQERLKPKPTELFINNAFRDGTLQTSGTAITTILPPTSRFTAGGGHAEKKQRVIDKLTAFFKRFTGLTTRGTR